MATNRSESNLVANSLDVERRPSCHLLARLQAYVAPHLPHLANGQFIQERIAAVQHEGNLMQIIKDQRGIVLQLSQAMVNRLDRALVTMVRYPDKAAAQKAAIEIIVLAYLDMLYRAHALLSIGSDQLSPADRVAAAKFASDQLAAYKAFIHERNAERMPPTTSR
jgi:hypothetical protein